MIFRLIPLLAASLVVACAELPDEPAERRNPASTDLPAMRTFAPQTQSPPSRSNASVARDFLELSFAMESGRPLPIFTRFEGPVAVRLTGTMRSASMSRDLDALLERIRREARISIVRVPADQPAHITIEAISQRSLQRLVPQAACFVVPNVTSWEEFRASRRGRTLDWSALTTRTRAAIFLPGDVAPQEARDCLHEELAQALGPLNDLYRLPDSVFNDDNFHTILTGFDMLILRATYSSELESGMTRAEVARRLPGLLTRINPAGRSSGIAAPIATPRAWIMAIERALGSTSRTARARAARNALHIAQREGWRDTRLAFSHYVVARLALGDDSETALDSFFNAASLYNSSRSTELQAAHVNMQLAAFALSSGRTQTALNIINQNLPVAARSENAALLAVMLFVKAEALELLERSNEAQIVRQDGLGWARYGFGSSQAISARQREIAALVPNVSS